MRSGTSFFNAALFRKNLSRIWPLWAGYIAIWLLVVPVLLWSRATSYYMLGQDRAEAINRFIREQGIGVGVILVFLFAALVACLLFSFLYSQKSVDMVASLPVKRSGVFGSAYLAGLVVLLSGPVLAYLIGAGMAAAWGASVKLMLTTMGKVLIPVVLFYGFACFCVMLTGNAAVMIGIYGVLNFTAVVVEYLITYILSVLVYGKLNVVTTDFSVLSPFVRLMAGSSQTTLLSYLAAGILFTALAALFYSRRRMESASDVVAIRWLKPVFQYCFAGGCALVLGNLIYTIIFSGIADSENQKAVMLAACLVVSAALGYFIAEMLLKKSFRVFRRWKGCAVLCALILVVIGLIKLDVFGVESYVPATDEIKSVTLNYQTKLTTAESIDECRALHQLIVASKEQTGDDGDDSVSLSISYELENGTIVRRLYIFRVDWSQEDEDGSLAALLNRTMNSAEAIYSRYGMDEEEVIESAYVFYYDPSGYQTVDLTKEQMQELYDTALVPDMADGTLGLLYLQENDISYYDCYIQWETADSWHEITSIPQTAQRTLAYLKALGIELQPERPVD